MVAGAYTSHPGIFAVAAIAGQEFPYNREIINLLATDKSQYFAQARPIGVKNYSFSFFVFHRSAESLLMQ